MKDSSRSTDNKPPSSKRSGRSPFKAEMPGSSPAGGTYKLTWCHGCRCPILACMECDATSCNGKLCKHNDDLIKISKKLKIDRIKFKYITDQHFNLEDKPIKEIISNFSTLGVFPTKDKDYNKAAAIIVYLASRLLKEGVEIWKNNIVRDLVSPSFAEYINEFKQFFSYTPWNGK